MGTVIPAWTSFERVVQDLKLQPDQYLGSTLLREWANLNKGSKFRPRVAIRGLGVRYCATPPESSSYPTEKAAWVVTTEPRDAIAKSSAGEMGGAYTAMGNSETPTIGSRWRAFLRQRNIILDVVLEHTGWEFSAIDANSRRVLVGPALIESSEDDAKLFAEGWADSPEEINWVFFSE